MSVHLGSLSLAACCGGLVLALAKASPAQDVPYGIGSWPEEGRGNHRALVRVAEPADAVRVHIPWRRRDREPEAKDVRVYDSATGARVTNIARISVTRESGDLVFQPVTAPGTYEVYYLPYSPGKGNFDDPGTYFPPEDTTDPAWLQAVGLTPEGLAADAWRSLPEAEVLAIQARTEFDRMDPMEVIATEEETKALLDAHPRQPYLLFAEDRTRAVRMYDELPLRWIRTGPSAEFEGDPQPGEYYVFQVAVWAARQPVTGLSLRFSDLAGPGGRAIPAAEFRCINLGGIDWLGRPLTKAFEVGIGHVRPLWIGLQIPRDAHGPYSGSVEVRPEDLPATKLSIRLNVAGPVLEDAGDTDLWRLSRLRWLDSTLALDDEVIPPFTPLEVDGDTIRCIGRSVTFGESGLPESITSGGREILAGPISLRPQLADATTVRLSGSTTRMKVTPGTVDQVTTGSGGPIAFTTSARMEFDGCVSFSTVLKARQNVRLRDVRLDVPIRRDVATYMMGMSRRGGLRPAEWSWKWDIRRADNMVWIGDVDAGLQVKLAHNEDIWAILDLADFGLPESWDNEGRGGCNVTEEGDTVRVRAYSGERSLAAGESIEFRYRLLITPLKPIDASHWNWRYGDISAGGTVLHLHHGTTENPYINYPFITADKIAKLVRQVKSTDPGASSRTGDNSSARGVPAPPKGVNIYYTVRELSNHVVEMWALRSLGDEVFSTGHTLIYSDKTAVVAGEGGGYPWLREHLVTGYVPAWRQPLPDGMDAAIATQGLSRWHNYYVEGMRWLMEHTGVDGLYLDGIGYDREIMKRIAKVMARTNPASRIQFHSGNNYDYLDTRVSPMNQYMEHLPYMSNLWFGEGYDYNSQPDYWLVEVSGIPFGLTSEMLEYSNGGNPYRGMIYGMSGRFHPSAPAMWRFWDEFGIQDAEMIGYWSPRCPVRTATPGVLTTVYRKPGKSLIAIADWSPGDSPNHELRLMINWQALGIDPAKARLVAPQIDHFQPAAVFSPIEPIPIEPGKGWLLVVEEREGRAPLR